MNYTLTLADGRSFTSFYDSPVEAVRESLQLLAASNEQVYVGDWDPNDKLLFWPDEESSQDDPGAKAIAKLEKQSHH